MTVAAVIPSGAAWEIYDLAADRTEPHDLAAERPVLIEELAALLDNLTGRCGVRPWDEVQRETPGPRP